MQQPRAGYLAFKLFLKGELQVAWPCAKLSDLWMSTDGKAVQTTNTNTLIWVSIQYRLTKIDGVSQNCPRDDYSNKLPVV